MSKGGGSWKYVRVRKMFGFIWEILPKSVPGIMKVARRTIAEMQGALGEEDAHLVGGIYISSVPHGERKASIS